MQNGGTSQISALQWTHSCTVCSHWNTHNCVPHTQVLSSIHRSWPLCCICEKAWEEVLFPIAEEGCLAHSHAPGDSQVFCNIITPLWKTWSRETGLEHRIPELYPSLLYEQERQRLINHVLLRDGVCFPWLRMSNNYSTHMVPSCLLPYSYLCGIQLE